MSTFNERPVKKTRKQHWCYGCDYTFPAGSASLHYFGIGDDGPWSVYFCPDCLEFKAKIGDKEFAKEYGMSTQNQDLCMNLHEDPRHPRYETEEQYNLRRKKEREALNGN